MGTIEDIEFDMDYSHATCRFLLLNEQYPNQIGPTPVIVLPNPLLFRFINVFHDLIKCQQYIGEDNRKIISLVITDKKIIEWDNVINVIDNNIHKVYIFCNTLSDYLPMKQWQGCYADKVQDVYLPDKLNCNLLKLGIDYIHRVMEEFHGDRGLRRKFCRDAQKLIRALDNYFQDEIESLDDVLGVEN